MKLNWFVCCGLFYVPVSVTGRIILAVCLVYSAYIFMDIDSRSHSVSDTLIHFVFHLLILGLAYTLPVFFTKRKPLKDKEAR